MTIRKPCEVEVRIDTAGEIVLLFTPLRGGEPERDDTGSLVRFAIPLRQTDAALVSLVRLFTRWVTDLVVQEMQAQQANVHRATEPTPEPSAEPPRRGRKAE